MVRLRVLLPRDCAPVRHDEFAAPVPNRQEVRDEAALPLPVPCQELTVRYPVSTKFHLVPAGRTGIHSNLRAGIHVLQMSMSSRAGPVRAIRRIVLYLDFSP